jgi:WD40 repeat protein
MILTKYKYKAFISYSHRNEEFAQWLHKALETYRIPRYLRKKNPSIPTNFYPIFRDQEELPTSSDLGELILDALQNSAYMIVICSPQAAKSHWVNQEIKDFKRMHGEGRILAVILDGEPNADQKADIDNDMECFPEALKYRFKNGEMTEERVEPIAADVRGGKETYRFAMLKLVAGLLDVGFEEIMRREELRNRQRRLFMTGALAGVSSLAAISIWKWQEADEQRHIAQTNEQEALRQKAIALANEKRAKEELYKSNSNLALLYIDKANKFLNFKHYSLAQLNAANALITQSKLDANFNQFKKNIEDMMGIIFCYNRVKCSYAVCNKSAFKKVIISSDSSYAYAAIYSGFIIKITLRTGELEYLLNNIDERLYDINLSDNEKYLYYITKHTIGNIKIENSFHKVLNTNYNQTYTSFTLSNKDIIVGTIDGKVIFFNKNTLKSKILYKHNGKITSIINIENKYIITSSYDSKIGVYDINSEKIEYIQVGICRVYHVVAHPKRCDVFYSSSSNGYIKEWKKSDKCWKLNRIIGKENAPVYDIKISNDIRYLISTSKKNDITIWDLNKKNKLCIIDGHRDICSSIAISNSSDILISSSWDKSLRFWDLAFFKKHPLPLYGHSGRITALSKNNKDFFATGASDNSIIIWDCNNFHIHRKFYGHDAEIYSLIFFKKGKLIISASKDSSIIIHDIVNNKSSKKYKFHTDTVYSLSFNDKKNYFASSSNDTYAFVYSLDNKNTPNKLYSIKHKYPVYHIEFIDENHIATNSNDKIYIWSLNELKIGKITNLSSCKYCLVRHNSKIYDFVIDNPKEFAYSCDEKGNIAKWNIKNINNRSPKLYKYKNIYNKNLYSIAVTDALIFVSSIDGKIIILDLDLKHKEIINAHKSRIYHLSFGKSKQLISVSWDGTIKIWDIKDIDSLKQIRTLYKYSIFDVKSYIPLNAKLNNHHITMQTIINIRKEIEKELTVKRASVNYHKIKWSPYNHLYIHRVF